MTTDNPDHQRTIDPMSRASALRHLDTVEVSDASRRETRNREVHLPPISIYRWWARRTESVFGAVIDAYEHDHPGQLLVVDPFAGGGVIPLAAVIRGHRVYAQDINPWAVTGLAAMLDLPSAAAIEAGLATLTTAARPLITAAYGTTLDSGEAAHVSHTFRVAVAACTKCGHRQRMYPHAVVTQLSRRERGRTEAYLACPAGHLALGQSGRNTTCPTCGRTITATASYTPRRTITCVECGHRDTLHDRATTGAWEWDVVLVERATNGFREIGPPTDAELEQATRAWPTTISTLGAIPEGRETRVLTRHGFADWADLYPTRQRYVIESLLATNDTAVTDPHVRNALRIAILGVAEMAGHLSRWDRWYLKSYESMAGHRFNLTTFTAEPNVWGTATSGRGTVTRRARLFTKAADWLHARTHESLTIDTRTAAPHTRRVSMPKRTDARIVEGSSERILLPRGTADLVLTDPPYHDDVEYDDLSLPLRAWAQLATERLDRQAVATGNDDKTVDYRTLMTSILTESARVVKRDGHVIFSYANRDPAAWTDLLTAINSAGLKAAGFTVAHSENETDQAKRNVRACTLDLILDLVPSDVDIARPFEPQLGVSDEEAFLTIVVDYLMRIHTIEPDWEQDFARELRATAFGGATTTDE